MCAKGGSQSLPPSLNCGYLVFSFSFFNIFCFLPQLHSQIYSFPLEGGKGNPIYSHLLSFFHLALCYLWNSLSTLLLEIFNQRLNSEELLRERFKFDCHDPLQRTSICGAFPVRCLVLFPSHIPVLEVRKRRPRVITRIVQGHSPTKDLIWEINPAL